MTVGEAIRQARKDAGLTQGQLAERAGVHRVYLSNLERNLKSPSLDVFLRLCDSLGVPPEEMIRRIVRR